MSAISEVLNPQLTHWNRLKAYACGLEQVEMLITVDKQKCV